MSITVPHQKELLSVSYAMSVAAMAGVVLTKWKSPDYGFELADYVSHDYGIDLTFSTVRVLPNNKRHRCGLDYCFQLKCTTNFTLHEQEISYRIEADAYNKFATWEGPTAYHLLVMCIPKEDSRWVIFTEDLIEMRHCCYWHYIPPGDIVKSDKTIHIPRQQLFDHNALLSIMKLDSQKQ